ncbi:MAG TPA: Hpt domain-containing protein [Sediminispirochaeta sp.]|nr:Hpt domain-containing protein [Sediminispirochaeta sp.]
MNKVFDQESFRNRCLHDTELEREIIKGSLPDLLAHGEKVKKALSEADYYHLNRTAHALKGTSGTVSAARLSELAQKIETLAKELSENREGDAQELADLVSQIDEEVESFSKIVHQEYGPIERST